ncbi:MAG: hypothetical protein PHN88_04140 [Ignavibacteria bacterium]|nr:hypothetical protein [Ignavibacteria bacterium]
MKKKIKYYVVFPALVVSALVLAGMVAYNFYNIYSFKVYLIAPETKILVSTEFTATILIKGKKMPNEIEVFIDDKLAQLSNANAFEYTDLGLLKVANLKIDPLYLSSGTHTMSVVLKGGMFLKDSKISMDFIYEKMNPKITQPAPEDIIKMKKFFSDDVPSLISRLNNARDYYVNSDWKLSDKYAEQKQTVKNADADAGVKEKFLKLISDIENKSSVDEINNSTNSLNLELYNKGYPFANLMFEYRYNNGSTGSFLLSYEISDTIIPNPENPSSKVYTLKRIDNLNITEQFLGIKLPNSPFSFILSENLELAEKRCAAVLSGDNSASIKEIKRMIGRYAVDDKDAKLLSEKIKEETLNALRKESLANLIKTSNAYHEIRHLNDYKEARVIGNSVPDVLKYFYADKKEESIFNIDSSFTREKDICETLLKVNPEYSAYLFELANSKGLRRYLLLSLFERIINPDKEDTSHHWASKLIIFNLAKMNNFTDKELVSMQVNGNEDAWFALTKRLIELPYEKLDRDAASLLMNEFR